ncbi:MAG: zinc ABC transporter substrate-binding protein [Candidatus Dasytiphilus stammeri]
MLDTKKVLFINIIIWIFLSLPIKVNAMVIVSIKPIGFIAAAITDGIIPLDVILPDGASPHNYSLHPTDFQRIRQADLLIWIGPEMEYFMKKPVAQLPGNKTLSLGHLRSIQSLLIRDNPNFSGNYNLHLWLSPLIAQQIAIAIYNKLLLIIPTKKDQLKINLINFIDNLSKIDIKIRQRLLPLHGRGYFTFHNAYRYFEKYYGLSPLGYFTVNYEIQPGAKHLNQIRQKLIANKVICIFTEPQFEPAVVNTVTRGIKVRKSILDPLGINLEINQSSYINLISQLSIQYSKCLK